MITATPLASNTYATNKNTNTGTTSTQNLSVGKQLLITLGLCLPTVAIVSAPVWVPAIIGNTEENKKKKELRIKDAKYRLPMATAVLESCKIACDIWPNDEVYKYKDEIVGLQETINYCNEVLKLDKNPVLKKEIELKATEELIYRYKQILSVYLLGWEQIQQLKEFGHYIRTEDLFSYSESVLGMGWTTYDQIGEVLRRLYEVIEQRANAGMINDKTEISKEKLESDANALKQKLIDKCNRYRRRSIENQTTN